VLGLRPCGESEWYGLGGASGRESAEANVLAMLDQRGGFFSGEDGEWV
jgi:hypothetical protein